MTLTHRHLSGLCLVLLLLCFHHLEMSSLHYFLAQIPYKYLHVLSIFLEVLKMLCLQSVVFYSAHMQVFCAKVHLVLWSHGPMLIQVVPLTFTSLPFALKSLLHHLLSFLLVALGLGHQRIKLVFPLHLMQRWREYYSSILEHIAHLSSSNISRTLACRKLLHFLLWGIDNHPQVSPCEMTHV